MGGVSATWICGLSLIHPFVGEARVNEASQNNMEIHQSCDLSQNRGYQSYQ